MVVQTKIIKWYEQRLVAQTVDILRATRLYAVSRHYLTQKRRLELESRRMRLGRRTYYILPLSEVPKRAKKALRDDWPIIDYGYGKEAESVEQVFS